MAAFAKSGRREYRAALGKAAGALSGRSRGELAGRGRGKRVLELSRAICALPQALPWLRSAKPNHCTNPARHDCERDWMRGLARIESTRPLCSPAGVVAGRYAIEK